jgi:CrcB protein
VAYLWAALGGVLGALARWAVSLALPAAPSNWPWATLLVNLSGCLLIGVLLAVLPTRTADRPWLRPFLAVGVLGGYTTFSTFAVEVVQLTESGALGPALGYVGASVVGGASCVLLGLSAARALLHRAETVRTELAAGENRT